MSAEREVRIDLRPDATAFMLLLAAVALAYVIWFSTTELSLAPVIVALAALLPLRFLRRPLTLQQAIIVSSERVIVASRRLVRRQKALPIAEVKELREHQVGSKENAAFELELVLQNGSVLKLGKLAPGFRPKLRGAQTLLRRKKR